MQIVLLLWLSGFYCPTGRKDDYKTIVKIPIFNFRRIRAIEKLLDEGWEITFRLIQHRGLFTATAKHDFAKRQECGVGVTLENAISEMLGKTMMFNRTDLQQMLIDWFGPKS